MPTYHFDDTKNFNENLLEFLNHMSAEDPEMGAVLRNHALKLIVDDSQRRTARTDFNDSVKAELDKMLSAMGG